MFKILKDARVGSGQDGLGTQIWRHEIKLVIKYYLVYISCHVWLLYIILSFSMCTYVGDMTVDEMLSASASAWNCHHNGTIVLIPRCTTCKCRPLVCCFTASFGDRGGGGTSLNHSSRTLLLGLVWGTCKCFTPLCPVRHCIVYILFYLCCSEQINDWLIDWLTSLAASLIPYATSQIRRISFVHCRSSLYKILTTTLQSTDKTDAASQYRLTLN